MQQYGVKMTVAGLVRPPRNNSKITYYGGVASPLQSWQRYKVVTFQYVNADSALEIFSSVPQGPWRRSTISLRENILPKLMLRKLLRSSVGMDSRVMVSSI